MSKGQQKATPKRQIVGHKAEVAADGGTQTPKGASPKPSARENADAQAEQATTRKSFITCEGAGSFQLREDVTKDGFVEHGWTLEFGQLGAIEATPEALEAVQKVLDGEWSRPQVTGTQFQSMARMVGLGIRTYGLEPTPLLTWDTLPEEKVAQVAADAGVLETAAQIRAAIRYEKQAPERQPKRDPRASLVALLEARLALHEAQGGLGQSQPQGDAQGIAQQLGAAFDGDAGLTAGAVELG